MRNFKGLKNFKQETGYTCGAAVLRTIFTWFNPAFNLPESEISALAQTNEEVGTTRENMEATVKTLGFYYTSKYESNLWEVKEELAKGNLVVAYFWSEAGENDPYPSWFHYAIFTEVTDEKIIMADPWDGLTHEYSVEAFLPLWYCDNGKKSWWISIYPKP